MNLKHWSHLENLRLADPNFNSPGKIDLLLGADLFPYIIEGGRVITNQNELSALNTVFGWAVMGKYNDSSCTKINSFFTTTRGLK